VTKFATEHADALADITENGMAVTFTARTVTTNPTTGETTVSQTTVAGYALQVRPEENDAARYQAAGLVLSDMLTLLFAPSTYGALPSAGSTCTLGSSTYTVRDVRPLAPDGTAILSRVGISR
jgi:hypothetical protein